jgi:copper chaperone CopZ
MTLYAPDVTCDHCIATISRVVDGVDGARFVSGDEATRSFVVEIDDGAVLDALGAALTAEGYPLGAASASAGDEHGDESFPAGWTPQYTISKTDAGADLNYACPCGCTAGFALDRSQREQPSESCCCGRHMLAGASAEQRLRASLDGEAYRIDVQQVAMPWGQPVQTAMAIPEQQ